VNARYAGDKPDIVFFHLSKVMRGKPVEGPARPDQKPYQNRKERH